MKKPKPKAVQCDFSFSLYVQFLKMYSAFPITKQTNKKKFKKENLKKPSNSNDFIL